MDDKRAVQLLEESRQRDINAMLLAILLIERGQTKEAQRVLMERLPEDIAKPIAKGQP